MSLVLAYLADVDEGQLSTPTIIFARKKMAMLSCPDPENKQLASLACETKR